MDYVLLFESLRDDYREVDREREKLRDFVRASRAFIRRDLPEARGLIRWADEVLAETEAGEQQRAPRWNGMTYKVRR